MPMRRSYNIARLSGGAIYELGSQALTMTIAESVFDSNTLLPPPDAPPVDLTVPHTGPNVLWAGLQNPVGIPPFNVGPNTPAREATEAAHALATSYASGPQVRYPPRS